MIEKIKHVTGVIVKMVQKIVITVSLVLLYFIGLGLTLPLALLFHRKLMGFGHTNDESFWQDAEGYESELEAYRRES